MVFLTHCDNAAILQRLHDKKLSVLESKNEFDLQSELLNLKTDAAWLVLAGYQFSPEYQQTIRETPVRKQVPKSIRNILVTMGGIDPCNATSQIVEALSQLDVTDVDIRMVVGSGNPHRPSLEEAVNESVARIELIELVRDMTELMAWADFVISAAGSTCWVLSAMGVPFATVVLADNQEELAHQLEKQASVLGIGISFSTRSSVPRILGPNHVQEPPFETVFLRVCRFILVVWAKNLQENGPIDSRKAPPILCGTPS